MATLSYPYCSLVDVQRETRNTKSSDNDILIDAINRASRYIDEYTNREFRYRDYSGSPFTVDRRFIHGDKMFLPWPVITLTVVDERGDDDTANVVETDDYGFRVGSAVVTAYGFNWECLPHKDTIEITGTFGYAEVDTETPSASIPPEIRRACTLLASAWSARNRRDHVAVTGEKTEVSDHTVPPEVWKLLSHWQYRQF